MRIFTFWLMIFALTIACNRKADKEAEQAGTAPETETVSKPPVSPKQQFQPQKVTIPAADGLPVSALLYDLGPTSSIIVLCHQAGFNKAEYMQIAPRLNRMGFSCLALDQRSGGDMEGGFENETFKLAQSKDLSTDYLDAEQDIIAGVKYANKRYGKPAILWGSSYSASLALKIGAENQGVRAVLAFSPGEYFGDKLNVKNAIASFEKNLFVTSSKKEAKKAGALIADINPDIYLLHFIPEGEGIHGSRALWETTENNAEYWKQVEQFLTRVK